jgi:hypothetical protein
LTPGDRFEIVAEKSGCVRLWRRSPGACA